MRMYLLSDNVDTLIGMRLSGVEGEVIHEEKPLLDALERLYRQDDIAIIMITETLVNLCRETIYTYKLTRRQPLLIEIPDRHGNGNTKDTTTRYVQEAIGVTLN